ncbi:phenylalanine--tRNA ligase subunit alpha [Candidatus Woesearchaeota archaeon]|jgi:phenylalanyl-tRNA synthetase alpha chain|nr:phenylalanine--tRNA ligase subunit alpha [Candidatus Woesearchaeota archaeon]MBT4151181.1 phenylalanine--tRNA ligase subunit alpha [Candidatus Woesearchaeota archaeon]MBT4247613.1 phenylalanine--tRNA ligase subunit alpha [Candidatus Woesearchaeota archaeon]MBT4433941.1 phenylalanine--tRNA ligase subunit alpha [Candidatus Woesearchaeota archaeon]MBT7332627.1 phenylalanine--tRNA ligase subunit alpha [Candidatus Woesearchaeota archaeon]
MSHENLIAKLHPLERQVLPALKDASQLSEIVKITKMQEIEIIRALQWLENKDVLKIITEKKRLVSLDKNGKQYKEHGLPEKIFLSVLNDEFKGINVITKKSKLSREEVNACIGLLKRKQAIDVTKGEQWLEVKITEAGKKVLQEESLEEIFLKQELPQEEKNLDQKILNELKKRKGFLKVDEIKLLSIELSELGKELASADLGEEVINRLTPGMLKTGSWKDKNFRAYDVEINVPEKSGGRRHPYNESLNIIRNAFLEMGFQEMEGPWIETSFWNMDAMWIPQDHPAREVQDTFYLDKEGKLPEDTTLIENVKQAHENGLNTGSTGHTKEWNPEVAKQLLLRTHSTATTFRTFHDKKLNHNCKYFYIANNFRNEAVDATHLAEFGQAEGFIMGDNLTLADLMGFIKEFYAKLGITKIRFKPTFNPYTEPSMEAHYYNEKLGKWYALINSGIFRPEALAPFGITKSVIAWGMGSSRIAAILSGRKKLKDLVGPEVPFEWIRKHQRIKI